MGGRPVSARLQNYRTRVLWQAEVLPRGSQPRNKAGIVDDLLGAQLIPGTSVPEDGVQFQRSGVVTAAYFRCAGRGNKVEAEFAKTREVCRARMDQRFSRSYGVPALAVNFELGTGVRPPKRTSIAAFF